MLTGNQPYLGPFTVAEAAAAGDTTVTLANYTAMTFADGNEYEIDTLSGYGLVSNKTATAFVLHNPAGAASTLDAIRFIIKPRKMIVNADT